MENNNSITLPLGEHSLGDVTHVCISVLHCKPFLSHNFRGIVLDISPERHYELNSIGNIIPIVARVYDDKWYHRGFTLQLESCQRKSQKRLDYYWEKIKPHVEEIAYHLKMKDKDAIINLARQVVLNE